MTTMQLTRKYLTNTTNDTYLYIKGFNRRAVHDLKKYFKCCRVVKEMFLQSDKVVYSS